MASSFGNLSDFFPEVDVKCRVRGCENRIHVAGEEVIQKMASGKSSRPDKMCDECYARLKTLEDKEMPCTTPGCDGTWIWNRYQQLEGYARAKGGEPQPPRGLCPKCQEKVASLQPQQRPCRLKGCKNTWTWTAREQQATGGKAPAPRLCDDCFAIFKTLEDKHLPCRVKGCTHQVLWTKMQQLEHIRAGKSLDNPPMRMCDDCFNTFSKLKNEERPCKINGCKNTWTMTPYDQLEVIRNTPEGQEPTWPARMCKDCFDFYSGAKDIEMPCRNRACTNTWVWTRSMQLGAHVHGVSHVAPKYCSECAEKLKNMADMERPCSVPGCKGTWTYRAEDQLRDQMAHREPSRHRCPSCQEFLGNHEPIALTCSSCGKSFNWSVQEQLAVELGVFVKPDKCPDCVSREIAGLAPTDPAAMVKSGRPGIHIPQAGEWNFDPVIREWPRRMDRHSIAKMENSRIRVVCIGDDATLSVPAEELSWPSLLEKRLQERFDGIGKVGVLNCGMKGCGTAQGTKRFLRDVAPFRPQLVIFSFAIADAMLDRAELPDEAAQSARLAKLSEDFDEFVKQFDGVNCKLLCWLPNPVFPQECEEGRFDAEGFKAWSAKQSQFYDLVQSGLRKSCDKHGITLLDARSLFEVNGTRSAQKWMTGWFMHNDLGAMNIANWLMDRISTAKLLDPADFPAEEPSTAEANEN